MSTGLSVHACLLQLSPLQPQRRPAPHRRLLPPAWHVRNRPSPGPLLIILMHSTLPQLPTASLWFRLFPHQGALLRIIYLNQIIMLDGTSGTNGVLVEFARSMADRLEVGRHACIAAAWKHWGM